MRKNLVRWNAGSVILAFVVAAISGGYWYWNTQHQEISNLQQQIDQLPDGKDKLALLKDRIALNNTINGSLVQAVGGVLLFVTAYVSLQNLKATQRNVLVAEEKQVTERFTQAINQLGSEKITVRVGGIYALERISKDSEKDYWTIMEVLTSFVREPLQSDSRQLVVESLTKIAKDVQAALTVICRRDVTKDLEGKKLDLSGANLEGADLIEARLNNADLTGANLSRVTLTGADLSKASLSGANLNGAYLLKIRLAGSSLSGANLNGVDLWNTDLTGVDLFRVKLAKAVLNESNLTGADLREADFRGASLISANLTGADLTGADLTGADLDDADLRNATLTGACLKLAEHLSVDQIQVAKNWEQAHYDDEFRQQLG